MASVHHILQNAIFSLCLRSIDPVQQPKDSTAYNLSIRKTKHQLIRSKGKNILFIHYSFEILDREEEGKKVRN
jgi:transposase